MSLPRWHRKTAFELAIRTSAGVNQHTYMEIKIPHKGTQLFQTHIFILCYEREY